MFKDTRTVDYKVDLRSVRPPISQMLLDIADEALYLIVFSGLTANLGKGLANVSISGLLNF